MNRRIGLAAVTASFLLTLSGGVFAQTPQTIPMNPQEARKAMLAARAARLSRKAPSALETAVTPEATGGGPGKAPSYTFSVVYAFAAVTDG
jgi:hypothetical protein